VPSRERASDSAAKEEVDKKERRENVLEVYKQEGASTQCRGNSQQGCCTTWQKKTELGTNKAQLNLTQHG
jgi:hypothetical protein